jgi:membrane protein DedA with SNARE-associated domain
MEIASHWIIHYGYFGLFSLLMLGIIGLPVPDETLLTFAGYLIYKHQLHYIFTLLAAYLGSICGISISFLLGHSLGLWLIRKYGKYVFITPEKIDHVHSWFQRYGKWGLVIGYFMPGVRHLTAYVAGASKLEYPTFALYAYSGGLIWASTFVYLGYALGNEWQKVLGRIHQHAVIGTVVIIVVFVVLWFLKKKAYRS